MSTRTRTTPRTIGTRGGAPQLINLGALKAGGADTTIISLPLIDTSGRVDVTMELLEFQGGGQFSQASFVSSTGKGNTRLNGGISTVADLATASAMTLVTGTLTGPGELDIPSGGTFTWTGGSMTDVAGGKGQTRVLAGGTLVLNLTGSRFLSERLLLNQGLISWTDGGKLFVSGAGTIPNDPNATINLQTDMQIGADGGTGSLINQGSPAGPNGTILKTGGNAIASRGIPLTNNGVIAAQTGAFAFSNGGQSVPAISNNGSLTPTSAAASVTVSGDFTQSADGTLNLKLGGPANGCNTSDTLRMIGFNATLAGGLNVTAVNCTVSGNPPPTFTILTFASRNLTRFGSSNVPQPYFVNYNNGSNPPSVELRPG